VINGPLITLIRGERTMDSAAVRDRWAIDHVATPMAGT
jgi:hypothetical protein